MRKRKPRVLFIMPSLTSGGAEKSLVTLLRVLGEQHGAGRDFDVDLFLFEKTGLFLPQLPAWVRVRSCSRHYAAFAASWKKALPYFLLRGRLDILWARYCCAKAYTLPPVQREEMVWDAFRRVLPRLRGRYAAAVAYLEGNATYYCAEKVKADRKIAFFHNDCRKFQQQRTLDERYFPAFDTLVSVSEACCAVLREAFPPMAARVRYVENIFSPAMLRQLAAAEPPPWGSAEMPTLLTIGRLTEQKGIDIAIRACGILRRAGVALRWFVIGVGGLEAPLRALIAEEGLEDTFILLGERANPYPAMAACDIYVQPSRYEGWGIALAEARALARPIVSTNFAAATEQITQGETGLLAEISAASLAENIRKLLEDDALRAEMQRNLAHTVGNEDEARKVMALLFGEENEDG